MATRLESRRVKKSELIGIGCLVQLVGIIVAIVCLGFGPLGWLLAVAVFVGALVVGSRMSTQWLCGHCNNPLANGLVTVCPSCRAELYSDRDWAARTKTP